MEGFKETKDKETKDEPFFAKLSKLDNALNNEDGDVLSYLALMTFPVSVVWYPALIIGGYTTTFLYDLLIKGPVKGIKKLKDLIKYGNKEGKIIKMREDMVTKQNQLIDGLKKQGFSIQTHNYYNPVEDGRDSYHEKVFSYRCIYNDKAVRGISLDDQRKLFEEPVDCTEKNLKNSRFCDYVLNNSKESELPEEVVKTIKQIDTLNKEILYITKYNEKLQDSKSHNM